MEMSVKTQPFLFTLLLIFLLLVSNVLSQDLEVSLELDTKETNLEGVKNQLNEDDQTDSKEDVESVQSGKSIESTQTEEADDKNKDSNKIKKIDTHEHLDKESEEDDTHENFDSHDDKTEIFLTYKNTPNGNEEPGFDLTPEEITKFKIWRNGDIPYYIDVVSFSDKVLRDLIRSFLRMVNDVTGLNFEEMPNPPSNDNERWVFFINRRGLLGCADHTIKNFTNQGVQQVVLGYDCLTTKGELAEAVMSIVGVPAQHNAPNRDNYIKVNTENIMPNKKHLFEKLNDNEWLFHDLEYDLHSITHYDIHKYSINGRATIEPKKQAKDLVPVKSLSPTDLLKIKMLYNYITRNKKLEVPECEKLFKPRSKYERFIPNDKHNIKPRKKPNKYLGIADSGCNESEPTKKAKNEEDEEKDDSNEPNKDGSHGTLNGSPDNPAGLNVNRNVEATAISQPNEKQKLVYKKSAY